MQKTLEKPEKKPEKPEKPACWPAGTLELEPGRTGNLAGWLEKLLELECQEPGTWNQSEAAAASSRQKERRRQASRRERAKSSGNNKKAAARRRRCAVTVSREAVKPRSREAVKS